MVQLAASKHTFFFPPSAELAAVSEVSHLANRPSQFGGSESETAHFLLCAAPSSFPVAQSTEETVGVALASTEAGSAAPIKYQRQSTDCSDGEQQRRRDKETH